MRMGALSGKKKKYVCVKECGGATKKNCYILVGYKMVRNFRKNLLSARL